MPNGSCLHDWKILLALSELSFRYCKECGVIKETLYHGTVNEKNRFHRHRGVRLTTPAPRVRRFTPDNGIEDCGGTR